MKINFLLTLVLVTTVELCQGYGYAKQHLTTNSAITQVKNHKFWTGDDVHTPATPTPAKRRVVRGVFFYTYDDNYNGREIEMHELNPDAFNKLVSSNDYAKKPAAVKSTFNFIEFFDGRCEATISCERKPEVCTERPCECTTTPILSTTTPIVSTVTPEPSTTTPPPTTTGSSTTTTPPTPTSTKTLTITPPTTTTDPPTTTSSTTTIPPTTSTPIRSTSTPRVSTFTSTPMSRAGLYSPIPGPSRRSIKSRVTESYPLRTWPSRRSTRSQIHPTWWTNRSTRSRAPPPPTTTTRYRRRYYVGGESFVGEY